MEAYTAPLWACVCASVCGRAAAGGAGRRASPIPGGRREGRVGWGLNGGEGMEATEVTEEPERGSGCPRLGSRGERWQSSYSWGG